MFSYMCMKNFLLTSYAAIAHLSTTGDVWGIFATKEFSNSTNLVSHSLTVAGQTMPHLLVL